MVSLMILNDLFVVSSGLSCRNGIRIKLGPYHGNMLYDLSRIEVRGDVEYFIFHYVFTLDGRVKFLLKIETSVQNMTNIFTRYSIIASQSEIG